jgi:hypothetical protein
MSLLLLVLVLAVCRHLEKDTTPGHMVGTPEKKMGCLDMSSFYLISVEHSWKDKSKPPGVRSNGLGL